MFAAGNSVSSSEPNYIESVFSTYLYTGNGSTQTITNGIDLAGKGGLVWQKERDSTGNNHALMDTLNGGGNFLQSNAANALATGYTGSFTSSGFTTGTFSGNINNSAKLEVSWTFREQPKFFDVVTYTGTGVAGLTVPHNLGSEPGCIIVKNITDGSADWAVYHRSIGNTGGLTLNNTNATTTGSAYWNNTSPTSTQFTLGSFTRTNVAGQSFVAYLFAHNAGGFGLTGTDNVISCGSYTQGAGDTAITLGYEPQWVMIKSTDATGSSWAITDNMRAMPVSGSASRVLNANLSNAESSSIYGVHATATGFISNGFTSGEFIYIAIRRGPMAVPTLGTSVFSPNAVTSDAAITTTGFTVDFVLENLRTGNSSNTSAFDRLRGTSILRTASTAAESAGFTSPWYQNNTGLNPINLFGGPQSLILYSMARAPGFFDEVCYSGNGAAQTLTHNLTAVPEFMISKRRDAGPSGWSVYSATLGPTKYLRLHSADAFSTGSTIWNDTSPTSSVFTVGSTQSASGGTYVQYLFATCPGVSKVGSYTGTGALQTVACGFTAGARFVLIKQTDGYADWYVWDSARGITSGNDPYLLLNDTAAEVTGTNYVDTDTTGFKVTAAAPAGINASGGTYIFLAIA